MDELLRIASDDSQEQPWPRVHALNTMRMAFSDKTLANDASGFFAQGMHNHNNSNNNNYGVYQPVLGTY